MYFGPHIPWYRHRNYVQNMFHQHNRPYIKQKESNKSGLFRVPIGFSDPQNIVFLSLYP